MRFSLLWSCLLALIAVGCTVAPAPTPTPPPDPLKLVRDSMLNLRQKDTFRMLVERAGAPYFVETDLGRVIFRRAEAQYSAPDILGATVRLIAAGLPTNFDLFSRGDNQWYRNDILTAGRWLNAPYTPGFNPETLIASDAGFQAAVAALVDLAYVGEETLEDGAPVYHLKATAEGAGVTALLAGLVGMTGLVNMDIYIHRELLIPVRFIIEQPDTVTEDEPEPTVWTIDIHSINEPMTLDDPEATAEATTPEAVG